MLGNTMPQIWKFSWILVLIFKLKTSKYGHKQSYWVQFKIKSAKKYPNLKIVLHGTKGVATPLILGTKRKNTQKKSKVIISSPWFWFEASCHALMASELVADSYQRR